MKKTKNGLVIVNQEQALKIVNSKPKGITLLGNVGIGKSWVFEQIFQLMIEGMNYTFNKVAPMYTANGISAMYSAGGMERIMKVFNYQLQGKMPLVIDDIGTEILGSSYGNKMDVVEWLILECYNAKCPIFVTSNLTLEDLTKRYGPRIVDRLKEKTYIIVLQGDSIREATYVNTEIELDSILNAQAAMYYTETPLETALPDEHVHLLEGLDT